jgi:UDP-N-acetylmuramate dehydrogenase
VNAAVVSGEEDVPRYVLDDGRKKIPAAWLVERSGFARGFTRGRVGVSSRHALALVHAGGGSTSELLSLAADIRTSVKQKFGITLQPEPVFLGFDQDQPLDSWRW